MQVDGVRPVDLVLAPGVQPDMAGHGFERDDWPALCKRVLAADIVVLCTPIWLSEESSVCRRVIERLYAESAKLNDASQYVYYGRVGGALVTGNEDGKHCAMPGRPAPASAIPAPMRPEPAPCAGDARAPTPTRARAQTAVPCIHPPALAVAGGVVHGRLTAGPCILPTGIARESQR